MAFSVLEKYVRDAKWLGSTCSSKHLQGWIEIAFIEWLRYLGYDKYSCTELAPAATRTSSDGSVASDDVLTRPALRPRFMTLQSAILKPDL